MVIHELKIMSNFANEIVNGNKTFEIRENDRGFQKGDRVKFNVLDMNGMSFPSHMLCKRTYEITYVLSGWGLKDGYVVFGIRELE